MLLAQSAMEFLHGDFQYMKKGLHAGNQIRTTFFNDGTYGTNNANPSWSGGIPGEWPINSGHEWLIDGNVWVASEVIDANGEVKHISSTVMSNGTPTTPTSSSNYSRGDADPLTGEWWTFLPLPGFARHPGDSIAMSKWPAAWPKAWPDKSDDPVDPGWPGKWNGYFGRDQMNADEEAFFVADDYNNREFNFYPDSLDHDRKGLGMRMWVRSFQWSNVLVQNVLFMLFDIENIGTYHHDKMAFGYKIGNNIGSTSSAGDAGDDCGAFDLDEDLTYMYDNDDIGGGGYTPVGYIGCAFLESPGNSWDGIDNDGDGKDGPGPKISKNMFVSKILNVDDPIILIDYKTFKRSKTTMPNDTIEVQYEDLVFKFWPGKEVEEIQNNLVDDNLNGIIDENNSTEYGTPPNYKYRYLYDKLKYIDYFTGEGLQNPLIDERRDDGIDNDGDWNAALDDLGQDGAPFTHDPGEGDGIPTYGEPHFDKTDIDETDMLGLTSFNLYEWPTFCQDDDEAVWEKLRPGKLDASMINANVELLWGCGYFPMMPDDIQRFSIGLVLAYTRSELLTNKHWMNVGYTENYNFCRAPFIPNLNAVVGDKRVTLFWDDWAEQTVDPITGNDFEGYRIYRSTDPAWKDMIPITSGEGEVIYRKPMAQFDLDNDIKGYAEVSLKGVQFNLGTDSGIRHSWTDTTVVNGFKYYYAVTSYDHGDVEKQIPPTECTKFISIGQNGEVLEKGPNVVVVRPEAPTAGFTPGHIDSLHRLPGSTTSGDISLTLVNPADVKDGHIYQITFEDSQKVADYAPDTLYTKNMNLIDVTNPDSPDTLVNRWKMDSLEVELPMIDGFELLLRNEPSLSIIETKTGFNNKGIFLVSIAPYFYHLEKECPISRDLDIIFGDSASVLDRSVSCIRKGKPLTAVDVNFTVLDATTGQKVPFGFHNYDGNDGYFSRTKTRQDEIVILNSSSRDDTLRSSLAIYLQRTQDDSVYRNPGFGDTLRIRMLKPFLSHDSFKFTMRAESMDLSVAKSSMDKIKVVPNPYIVANGWEPANPYSDGRGERQLHFTHLPPVCTIRIFNVSGQLVATLNHDTPSWNDGTEIWNMLSKDQLDISYGVYVYHVDAGKLGTKIGKFAVIK
ncbi:MAG: hypothetical protein JXB18_14730 [Sedimentisphaerales bacterium]|nr:hypothetical protein [Sedimentisphaerales bacterium]